MALRSALQFNYFCVDQNFNEAQALKPSSRLNKVKKLADYKYCNITHITSNVASSYSKTPNGKANNKTVTSKQGNNKEQEHTRNKGTNEHD
jgi:hypothetical protein